MAGTTRGQAVRWSRLLPAVVLLAVVVAVLTTRWDVVTANHPAYLVLLALSAVAAAIAVATSFGRRARGSTSDEEPSQV